MKTVPLFAALSLALTLASCNTVSQVSLDYVPSPGRIRQGQAEFTTRQFSDQRGEEPTFLGTVRTQIGTPVERVQTRSPVAQIVTNAFGHGLQARGMLTSPSAARYIVTGDVMDLYCQMLVRPSGYARIRVKVVDAGSGQILFNRVFEGERTGAAYLPGSGSPVPDLRVLTSGALQDAVDRALDDGDLRAIVEGMGPRPGGPNPRFVPGML
jgi:hypothetical protein